MPRLLAFDFGTKRLGIAVTDPMQLFATGLTTIHPKDVIEFLKKYLLTEQIETFIVGDPKQMDGSPSQSAPMVKGFVTILKKHFPTIPVAMMDERFTSKMASFYISQSGKNKKKREEKGLIDKVSATLILQNYLEQKQK